MYGVISYGKCGMSFSIIKLHEEKSYCVSPHVALHERAISLIMNPHRQYTPKIKA